MEEVHLMPADKVHGRERAGSPGPGDIREGGPRGKGPETIAGIPSYNSGKTISRVAGTIGRALGSECGRGSCVLIDCDGGSTDSTVKRFLASKTPIPKQVLITKPGTTGKGAALRMLLEYARKSGAKNVIVNDSDLRSIDASWVRTQLDAIRRHGYDFAAPHYRRSKHDGLITKHVCYPLVYGLFCKDVRQPIGGDFAFSGRLARRWLDARWPDGARLFGIDIFMTTSAILGGFRICQVDLGVKTHDTKEPSGRLLPMFRQVTGTLFEMILGNRAELRSRKRVSGVKTLGPDRGETPRSFTVDEKRMKEAFVSGFRENREMIGRCLSAGTLGEVEESAASPRPAIEQEVWVKVLLEYIASYSKLRRHGAAVLDSLSPMWLGRSCAFIDETREMDDEDAEKLVKGQARRFFRERDHLLRVL